MINPPPPHIFKWADEDTDPEDIIQGIIINVTLADSFFGAFVVNDIIFDCEIRHFVGEHVDYLHEWAAERGGMVNQNT